MRGIALTRGLVTLVDDTDYLALSQHKWHAKHLWKDNWYAARAGDAASAPIYMHRAILNPEKGQAVHHINGNTLDNRRENLIVLQSGEHGRLHNGGVVRSLPGTYNLYGAAKLLGITPQRVLQIVTKGGIGSHSPSPNGKRRSWTFTEEDMALLQNLRNKKGRTP